MLANIHELMKLNVRNTEWEPTYSGRLKELEYKIKRLENVKNGKIPAVKQHMPIRSNLSLEEYVWLIENSKNKIEKLEQKYNIADPIPQEIEVEKYPSIYKKEQLAEKWLK